jgi:hypothetical protein
MHLIRLPTSQERLRLKQAIARVMEVMEDLREQLMLQVAVSVMNCIRVILGINEETKSSSTELRLFSGEKPD